MNGACPTGKRVYYTERLANRAISRALERGELDPLRHYHCEDCGWWHLSRIIEPKRRRQRRRKRQRERAGGSR